MINLLSKCNNERISRRGIDKLNELRRRHDETKDPDLMPNNITFNAALSVLAKGSNTNDIHEAKTILQQMEQLHYEGYSDIKPDAFTMTNMISCYAHSKVDGAAEQAEEMLQHMQELYDQHGDHSMRPNIASFGAVLNAWAREGNAERAQAIVDHMESLQDEYEELSANTVIYNTLINSWAKSGSNEAGCKAADILEKMQTLYKNGNKEVKPTRITYNSVMSAYHKSGHKDAFIRSKQLLDQMEVEEDTSIHPDVVTYTTFLNIASKFGNSSVKIDAVEQVWAKLRNKKPNNFFCDAILRVCIYTNTGDTQIRRKALVLSLKALTLIQESPQIVPTSYSYSLFFSALSKHSSGTEQHKLLNRTLQDCCKAGLLTDSILHQLMRSFDAQLIRRILLPNNTTDSKDILISIKSLPREWSSNAKNELPSGASQRTTRRAQHNTGRKKITRQG